MPASFTTLLNQTTQLSDAAPETLSDTLRKHAKQPSARCKGANLVVEGILYALDQFAYYDPKDGGFRSKYGQQRGPRYYAQHEPLGCLANTGYLHLRVGGKTYTVGRLVWLWHHGKWPEHEVDHDNRNKLDNRIENIRDATHLVNSLNRKKYSNNTTGVTGVWLNAARNKYEVGGAVNGERYYLGLFASFKEAALARFEFLAQHPEFADDHGE